MTVLYSCSMGNQRAVSTARLLFCFAIHTALYLGLVYANNPFEGNIFSSTCMSPRPNNTGCPNETLSSAYKKTKWSKSDKNMNEADTYVYLLTSCDPHKAEFLHKCGGTVPENTNFRPDAPTIIIIGGYMSPICFIAIFREMKDQLLCSKEFRNVMLVDWVWGNGPDYHDAARNTEVVGKQLAFLIANIIDKTGAQSKNFHLVGHSLGAHIAGCAGEYLKKMGKEQLRRITGMDPAGPGFMENMSRCSLSKDDAAMVDIIHSNAGHCLPLSLGYPYVMGDADFFPNGGSVQLSCYGSLIESIFKGDFYYTILLTAGPFCPHFQSVQYFKESINPCDCHFVGVECTQKEYKTGKCNSCGSDGSKCAVMGYYWEFCQPKFGNHSYYLKTKKKCPHCTNKGIDLGGFLASPQQFCKEVNCYQSGKCPVHRC